MPLIFTPTPSAMLVPKRKLNKHVFLINLESSILVKANIRRTDKNEKNISMESVVASNPEFITRVLLPIKKIDRAANNTPPIFLVMIKIRAKDDNRNIIDTFLSKSMI